MAGQAGLPAPVIQPGEVLAGRYRLERMRAGGRGAQLWRATDEVLARTVAVRTIVLGRHGPTEDAIRSAVARAGAVAERRLVRVLDFDSHDTGRESYCFVVTEWLDSPALGSVLGDGPMPAEEAAELAWQVADALSAAARRGAAHGRLHPSNVFLTPAGEVRITDLEIGRLLAGSRDDLPAVHEQDTRDIGALLYATLTGHWPLPGPSELPAAPRTAEGRPYRPRQVSAGVPREVDDAAWQLLTAGPGGVDTPARAAAVLGLLPRARRDLEGPPAAPPAAPGPARRWLWRVVPPLILLGVLFAAYTIGEAIGRVPSPTQQIPSFTAPGAGPKGAPLHLLAVPTISVFNPYGHDPEDVQGARLAVDGDTSTAWYTFRYIGNPVFGGLKPGVGLLVDLGAARSVREIHIALVSRGADLEVLSGGSRSATPAGYSVVARRADAPLTFFVTPARAVTARYWVIWLTRLPAVGPNSYQDGLAEIAFYS